MRPEAKTPEAKTPESKRRYTRWTADLKAAFLAELGRLGTVSGAAERVGACRRHVYSLRQSDPDFAQGFADALEEAADRLEEEARRRAVEGVEVPIVHGGKVVTDADGQPLTIRRYSDALLLALLKARRPEHFRDRVSQEVSGPHGGPIVVTTARQRFARALEAAVARGTAGAVPGPRRGGGGSGGA